MGTSQTRLGLGTEFLGVAKRCKARLAVRQKDSWSTDLGFLAGRGGDSWSTNVASFECVSIHCGLGGAEGHNLFISNVRYIMP